MVLIKKLCEMIIEELQDANNYAECALKHKEDNPVLSKTFYDLATDELRHMQLLHDQVAELIRKHKEMGSEVPESMQAVYDYLHEKEIEYAVDVKALLAMYR